MGGTQSHDGSEGAALWWAIEAGDLTAAATALARCHTAAERATALHWGGRAGVPPLVVAAARGHELGVRLLVESGADPRAATRLGNTALVAAATRGHAATVAAVLAALGGARPAANACGAAALVGATLGGHAEVVLLLLQQGADPNARDVGGASALQAAVYLGHDAIAERLVLAGADPEARNPLGRTAMDFARLSGATHVLAQAQRRARLSALLLGAHARSDDENDDSDAPRAHAGGTAAHRSFFQHELFERNLLRLVGEHLSVA